MSRVFAMLLISLHMMLSAVSHAHAQSNPTPIATFEREEVGGGAFGYHMAHGDINGDGTEDLAVSDGAFEGVAYGSGRVYVFFGRSFSGAISASSADIKIDGIQHLHAVGIPKIGNLDGDEYADLVIGAPNYWDSTAWYNAGRVYVFLGKSIRQGGTFTVNQADFFFKADSLSQRLDVAALSDFDGDGLDDYFLYSFSRDGYHGQNRLSVFYTKNLTLMGSVVLTDEDTYFYGSDSSQTLSYLFSSGTNDHLHFHDLNGDAYGDLVANYTPSGLIPDTISIFFGQNEQYQGGHHFKDGNVIIANGYDLGGYALFTFATTGDFDGDGDPNLIIRAPYYHFDSDYNNQFGLVYMFKDAPQGGTGLENASTRIRGTISGILSGNFGLRMDVGGVDDDGKNEIVFADEGYGLSGAQFLFRGRDIWKDSLSDLNADVKIFGNSGLSGLANAVMLADIMGIGKSQWLAAYSAKGSRVNGFVDLYPSSVLTGIEEPPRVARSLMLHPNYPNPFNPSTTVAYELPYSGQAALTIFDVLGQKVRTLAKIRESSGLHKIVWDGKNDRGQFVASGVYIVRLQFDNKVKSRKIMLLK